MSTVQFHSIFPYRNIIAKDQVINHSGIICLEMCGAIETLET